MMSERTPEAPGWLHIGTGAFHRAHQAFYLDRLNGLGPSSWRLSVGNIKPDLLPVEDALRRSGGAFHLETVTPEGERNLHLVRSIASVIGWEAGLSPLIDASADPATRIVSFTVTEAGYHVGPDGRLDPHSRELAYDLAEGGGSTIYGVIARILQVRMADDAPGLTLLCCDNIRGNGDAFCRRLFDFLDRRSAGEVRRWTEACCTFPNSMVDRITPRASPELHARVRAATGEDDPAAVMAEAYVQWVIEDAFASGRPPLERVGVEFVGCVEPYEEAKIRVLNASHALLAWRGAALGLDYIHECVAVPELRQEMIRYVTQDVIPCLSDSPVDLRAYLELVIGRFSTPAIQDTVARVAADGCAKIAGWIVPTMRERLDAGARPLATAAIATAFLTFLDLWRAGRLKFTYADQTMKPQVIRDMLSRPDPVAAFAEDPELWNGLAGRPDLLGVLRAAASGHSA